MLATHPCVPGCGCGADFVIDPRSIGCQIDWVGDDAVRLALRQLDDLIARGHAIEEPICVQCDRFPRPPDTVRAWLLRWRSTIEQALRDFRPECLPTVAEAEAERAAAADALFAVRRRLFELERVALEAARQDPTWCASAQVHGRAWRKLMKLRRPRDPSVESKLNATMEAARAVMGPIEEACRARDPQHAATTRELQVAESALEETNRRLGLATVRAERTQPPIRGS